MRVENQRKDTRVRYTYTFTIHVRIVSGLPKEDKGTHLTDDFALLSDSRTGMQFNLVPIPSNLVCVFSSILVYILIESLKILSGVVQQDAMIKDRLVQTILSQSLLKVHKYKLPCRHVFSLA